MFKDTTELAENKLLLLYILNKINTPISNSHITQIILENNLINYFSLQQYLSELIEKGFIEDFKEDKRHMLNITPQGKGVLEFFTSRIPDKKTDLIDSYLDVHIKKIKKEVEVISEYEISGTNKFIVTLKLKDQDATLIELKIPASTNADAKNICSMWKENSDEMYKNIISLFNK
jgi:predicted transcriptional regulator